MSFLLSCTLICMFKPAQLPNLVMPGHHYFIFQRRAGQSKMCKSLRQVNQGTPAFVAMRPPHLSVGADDDFTQVIMHGRHRLAHHIQCHVNFFLHSVSFWQHLNYFHHHLTDNSSSTSCEIKPFCLGYTRGLTLE